LRDIPHICYKKATQVFDTNEVDKDISGFYPPANEAAGLQSVRSRYERKKAAN